MLGTRVVLFVCASLFAAAHMGGCGAGDNAAPVLQHYQSMASGLSFPYRKGLYLFERYHDTGASPRVSLALVEDLPLNRAYLAGTVDEPMEGPPMIAIDIYDNPEGLPAEEWVAAHTNWILADKRPQLATFGDRTFLVYFWDGLYAGKSAVAVDGRSTVVFSVTWISQDEELLQDFSALLSDVELTLR